MADAFKGLTIRLGADARPLNSAIASVRTSAAQAQKQLTAMNKALKFDKTNVAAMGARIDLMGDKATLAARSVRDIRIAMGQASEASRKLGVSTKNVYAETHKVRSSYNHVNASLQRIYDDVRKIVAEEHGWAEGSKKVDNYMKKLKESFSEDTAEARKLRKEMEYYLTVAHRQYGTGDAYGLRQTFTDGKKLMSVLKDLRSQSGALGDKLEGLKAIEGLSAMRTQLIAWESEMREAITETVRFKSELFSMNAAPGVAKSIALIERMDVAIDDAAASARKMNQVFKAAPGSIEAATSKLIAERHQTEILADKISEYRSILRSIENTGFDKTIVNVRNVHKWVSQAKTACIEWEMKIESARAALESLQRAKDDLEGVKDKTKEAAARYAELEHRIENVAAALVKMDAKTEELNADLANANKARRYKQVDDDLKVATAAMTKATTKASALRRALDFTPTIRTMGYGLYSTVTPAIMIAGRYAIQAARDIDAAYRDMRKTVNGTEKDFEQLRSAALEFSTTHFTSAEKILEIEAMGGQLGIAVSNLEAFAETVSNLDVATNIDADTAAEQLGKMATVLNLSVDQYDNFGDALVRLGNNMPVMESDILTLTTRFMGMGKVVGMQPDQMLAWAAAASATGQKAEAAGSSMQRFISKMETSVATGDDYLETFASISRMTVDEFTKLFKEDASQAMYKFIEGLGEMQKSGESVNQALGKLDINNVRDKQLLEGLAVQMANAGDGASVLEKALQMSSDAYKGFSTRMEDGSIEEAGDAAREAAKKAEGFSGQIEMMTHDAQLLAQELAQGALPYVKLLAGVFKGATEAIKAMPQEAKTAIVGFIALIAAIGPVAVAVGALGSAFLTFSEIKEKALAGKTEKVAEKGLEGIASAGQKIAKRFPAATNAVTGFGAGLTATGASLAAAIAFIVLLTAEIGMIAKVFMDAREKSESLTKATTGLTQATGNALKVYTKYTTGNVMDDYADKTERSTEMVNDLIESQGKLVDSINERAESSRNEIANLNQAEEAIDKYMNTTGLTVAQQGALRNAVELLNTQYGTQYKVVDAANGKIADEKGVILSTKDALLEYIETKKKQIRAEQLAADAVEIDKALDESVVAYTQAWKEYNDYAAKYGEQFGNENAVDEFGRSIKDHAEMLGENMRIAAECVDANEEASRAIEAQWDMMEQSNEKQLNSIAAAAARNSTLQALFMDDINAFSAFKTALGQAGLSMEDFGKISAKEWGEIVAAWDNGNNDLSEILSRMGYKLTNATEETKTAFENMGLSFDEYVQNLGGNADELSEKMRQAGGASTLFANVSKEQIAQAMAESNGSVDAFINKLQEFGAQNVKAEVTLTANDQASAQIEGAESVGGEYDGSEYSSDVSADNVEALESFDEADSAGDRYDTETYTASAGLNTSSAYSSLSSLKKSLDEYANTTWTAKVSTKKEDAAGGFYKFHAVGGFVTNGPTFLGYDKLGVGHIAGEAGREWIKTHADGTTSIIPIENRKYLKPYARDIASMIGGGSTTTNYTLMVDGTVINDDPHIRGLFIDLMGELQRKAAMNFG